MLWIIQNSKLGDKQLMSFMDFLGLNKINEMIKHFIKLENKIFSDVMMDFTIILKGINKLY